MFKLLRGAGWIGGLVALARTSTGQKVIAKAKEYVTNPENRGKLDQLRNKAMGSRGN